MVERKLNLRRPIAKPAAAPVLKKPGTVAKPGTLKKPGKVSAASSDPFADDDKPAPARGGVLSGFGKAREINKVNLKAKEARMAKPMVFKVPPGGSARCVLLDKEPYRVYLHNWQDGAKRFHEEVCIRTEGFCPVCAKLGQEGTYTLMFTCVSLVPFKDREGKEHKFSKMLFPIKPGVAEKFERMYLKAASGDVNKGFRGMAMTCFRSSNAKAPRTGDDFEFAGWMRDADLLKKYGADLITACEYDKAFPRLSIEELASKYSVDVKGVPGAEDIAGSEANWAADSSPF
jgi:hypothetical protein